MQHSVFTLVLGAGLGLTACGGQTSAPGPGDPFVPPGDPGGGGDHAVADPDAGDPSPGDAGGDAPSPGDDSPPVAVTPSTQLCAAGGQVASASYHGVLCLAPLGSSGQVSSSASYTLISAPAPVIEAP